MNGFIKYLQSKNYSLRTQEQALNTVNKFLDFCQKEDLNVSKKDILNYLEHLQNKGLQNSSVNITLRQLRYYFDFLASPCGGGLVGANPTNLLKIRGIKRRQLYKTFTPEELAQLADDYYNVFVKNTDDNHIPQNLKEYVYLSRNRNYLMLTFLLYQGLATNELTMITTDDIDLIKATVKIRATNRTNERKLNLKAEQIGALMHYQQNIRPLLLEHYTHETDLLFLLSAKPNCTVKSGQSYNNIFNTLKNQIQSINPSLTNLMQLRVSVITQNIQTHGLRKAQYFAGHRYTSSTENYLPNDISKLTNDMEVFNPF